MNINKIVNVIVIIRVVKTNVRIEICEISI